MSYPNPCNTCAKVDTCQIKYGCQEWRIRYLYRQKQVNAYAKKHGILPTTVVELPTEDPCQKCSQNEFCDRICPARAAWWDVCMEKLRGRLGV